MDPRLAFVRQVIERLLRNRQPELGARLKQSLQKELAAAGDRFDEAEWGFAKFSDFLQANDDLVVVTLPGGPGDVRVRLQASAPDAVKDGPRGPAGVAERTPIIPSAVWQAFTNPEPSRKRFVHRSTFALLHYVAGDGGPAQHDVESAPWNYIEVDHISGADHLAWMREFLQQVQVSEGQKSTLERIAVAPYSSAVAHVFAAALGAPHSEAWRRFRARKVYDRIVSWTAKQGIPLSALGLASDHVAVAAEPVRLGDASGGRRQAMHLLIDAMADADLDSVLVPLAVAVRALSRRSE